eukprot:g37837.t1
MRCFLQFRVAPILGVDRRLLTLQFVRNKFSDTNSLLGPMRKADTFHDLDALVDGSLEQMQEQTDLPIGSPSFRRREPRSDELSELNDLSNKALELMYATRPAESIAEEAKRARKARPCTMEEYFFEREPNPATMTHFLHVLTAHRAPASEALRVLAEAKRLGIKPNDSMTSQLCTAIAASRDNEHQAGRERNSQHIFDILKEQKLMQVPRNVTTYGAMMHALAKACDSKAASALTQEMKQDDIKMNEVIYTALISACLRDNQVQEAWRHFSEMRHQSIWPDPLTYNTMIRACAETLDAEKALDLLEEMKSQNFIPDLITYRNLIYSLSQRKDYYEKAFGFFKEALDMNFDADVRTFNIMLNACSVQKDLSTFFFLLETMDERRISKDLTTYNIHLSALKRTCRKIYFEYKSNQFLSLDERLQMAWNVFEDLQRQGLRPNVITLNTMVSIHAHTRDNKALDIVETLFPEYGIKPNYFTYQALIRMYGARRDLDKAREVLAEMKEAGIPRQPEIYKCILHISKRRRDLQSGLVTLQTMRSDGFDPATSLDPKLLEIFEPPIPKLLPPSFNRFRSSGRASRLKGAARPVETKFEKKYKAQYKEIRPRTRHKA